MIYQYSSQVVKVGLHSLLVDQTSSVLINWFCCHVQQLNVVLCRRASCLEFCRFVGTGNVSRYTVLCLYGTAVKPRRTLNFCHTTFTSHGTTLNCRKPWKSDCPLLHRTPRRTALSPAPHAAANNLYEQRSRCTLNYTSAPPHTAVQQCEWAVVG